MKKILKITVAMVMAASLCACGASVSTEKSETGQLNTSIVGTKVKLNNVEYEFPEGYTFDEGKVTSPIGMSYATVYNKDGNTIGVCSDGMYTENITKENMIDAANTAYMTVHNLENPLDLTEDMFLEAENVVILIIELDDGTAIFTGQLGTPNFSYITETTNDVDLVMQDYLSQVILQLGGQEDYDLFFTQS
ncbi:MAG: hypothetical protein K6F41_03505 [Lachnospira sp.]|nr:hypothetical protein [Lachnospira sp.]